MGGRRIDVVATVGGVISLAAAVLAQEPKKAQGANQLEPPVASRGANKGSTKGAGKAGLENELGQSGKAAPKRGASFPGVKEAGAVPALRQRVPELREAIAKTVTLVETTDEAQLRYLRTEKSDAIGTPLPKGALLLKLGEPSYGMVQVALPGGFEGYVYRTLLEVDSSGWGTTKRPRVSFRHEPRSGVPPLDVIQDAGTRLAVLGLEGDWYRVLSNDTVRAWVPVRLLRDVTSVTAGAGRWSESVEDPALAKRLAAQITALSAKWATKRKEVVSSAARATELVTLEGSVDGLRKVFESEKAKGKVLEEDLGMIEKGIAALKKKITAVGAGEEPVAAKLAALAEEVRLRKTRQEAERFLAEAAKRKAAAKRVEVRKAKSREKIARRSYTATGWLEYRPGPNDYSEFRIVKGGRLLYYVICSERRYNLRDFVGHEVGIRGDVDRPDGAAVRVINAKRLVILSGRR